MILFRNVWKNKIIKEKKGIFTETAARVSYTWHQSESSSLAYAHLRKDIALELWMTTLWIHSRAKNPQILKNHVNLSLSFEFWLFDDLANVLHDPASLPPQTITASLWQLPTPMSTEHEAGMSEPTCSKPAARENFQYNPPNLWSWFPPNPVESVWVKTARGNMSAPGNISASSCGRDGANCLHSYAETKPNHQSES